MKKYKPKLVSNKKYFSYLGVIFQREGIKERNAIVMCHWPHCGMNSKTARLFATWLIKRADEMDKDESTK